MLIPLAPTRTLASGVRDMPTSPPTPSIENLATTPNRGLKMPSPFMGGPAAGSDGSSQVSAKAAVATLSENRNGNKSLYDTKHSLALFEVGPVWKGASMDYPSARRGGQMTAGQGRVARFAANSGVYTRKKAFPGPIVGPARSIRIGPYCWKVACNFGPRATFSRSQVARS